MTQKQKKTNAKKGEVSIVSASITLDGGNTEPVYHDPVQDFAQTSNPPLAIQAARRADRRECVLIPGLHGDVPLVYADYVASGRALRQVEDFVAEQVLPFYANSHTEASYCGSYMTRLRREARAEIARIVGARGEDAVIFTGSGATAGLNRLVSLLGVEGG